MSQRPVWEDADSSMISAFRYTYYDVPADVVEGLREASSKGSYMRSMIIDMYAYDKG